ncbi:hypothetical protein GQ602_000692 [Ophiocordyceps camponoti-floridani]|uniref:ABC transporter domain-containing protein n=1 Tax=Ophiocordyceps camponoti-floridani TaxID=2030778 RepID=A0A8H4VGH5_9HYPO|nr:hypothetical protein GQ602_000692 [Ophiocordyceps camponoti-floridani]
MTSLTPSAVDVERQTSDEKNLTNSTVQSIAWRGVTITVPGRKGAPAKKIIDGAQGVVEAGELCAIMGPSGAGKTSLLNHLARRESQAAKMEGEVLVNGRVVADEEFRRLTSFVEQQDALISSLTCFETVDFNVRLTGTKCVFFSCLVSLQYPLTGERGKRGRRTKTERIAFVNKLLRSLGLDGMENSFVGPFYRGNISGGEKRRLSVASQVGGEPKILFLDEPTSGIDSTGSQQMVRYLRELAKSTGIIIVCSIHQPSAAIFHKFDKLVLVSEGRMCYFGSTTDVVPYLEKRGHQMPPLSNPAEFILDLVNTSFSTDQSALDNLCRSWESSDLADELRRVIEDTHSHDDSADDPSLSRPSLAGRVVTLLRRSLIKSYRDPTVYLLRAVLYLLVAIIIGTIWPRHDGSQQSIDNLMTATFISTGFASLISVSCVPPVIEDIKHHLQEKRNGYSGCLEFSLSNFLLGLPYLLLISLLFSVVTLPLNGLKMSAGPFFCWLLWHFLGLVTMESAILLIAALVIKLNTAVALLLLVSTIQFAAGGYVVKAKIMTMFYKYVLYYWDFLTYTYRGMLSGQFRDATYDCGPGCQCTYPPMPEDPCRISGNRVLEQLEYSPKNLGRDIGIVLAMVVGYRLAAWVVISRRG